MGESRSRSRDRGRDRGGRDRDRDKRRRRSSDSRSRDRDRDRDRGREKKKRSKSKSASPTPKKKRASKWDAPPGAPGAATPLPGVVGVPGIGMPGQNMAAFAQMGLSIGGRAAMESKKSREIFVGSLLQHQVTQMHLRQFFKELFEKVPEFADKYPHLLAAGPVIEVQIGSDGKFAFVEFATEELAVTALEFDRCELLGRPIKTGRSNNYVPMGPQPLPLDVSMLRAAGFINPVAKSTQARIVNPLEGRKQRELFVGQLPPNIGGETISELFTPACQLLPEYNAAMGPPVLNVDIHSSGTYGFVEFQSHDLATAAKGIFHNMEVLGKKLTVDRPSGYVPPGAVPSLLPPAMQNLGMPALTNPGLMIQGLGQSGAGTVPGMLDMSGQMAGAMAAGIQGLL